MKLLGLLFLIGCATAFAPRHHYNNDEAVDGVVDDFHGVQRLYRSDDEDAMNKLKVKLRETFGEMLEKIKDSLKNGKMITEDAINKMKEVRQKLKELKIDMNGRIKELIQEISDKAKEFLEKILGKLGFGNGDKEIRGLNDLNEFDIKELIGRAEGNNIEKNLRDAFDKLLEEAKKVMEKHGTLSEDIIEKLKSLKEKMKTLKIDISETAKDLAQKLKDKIKDYFRNLLNKLEDKNKENNYSAAEHTETITELLINLKNFLKQVIDKDVVIQKVHDLFGKGNAFVESLVEMIKSKGDKGKLKLIDFIERILSKKEERERRSLKELWEKVKNFFKDLNIKMNEKWTKFGEWVKETASGLDQSKPELENVKAIAIEFIANVKKVSKEIAGEGQEFFRQYKDELGIMWDEIKDVVKEKFNKSD